MLQPRLPTPASAPKCVVPKLKGKTLTQAKKLIARAHRKLGKISRPKACMRRAPRRRRTGAASFRRRHCAQHPQHRLSYGTVFARQADGALRPTKWTDERIEADLRVLEGRDRWPKADEWRAAGKKSLYDQASASGGIKRWRHRLGY